MFSTWSMSLDMKNYWFLIRVTGFILGFPQTCCGTRGSSIWIVCSSLESPEWIKLTPTSCWVVSFSRLGKSGRPCLVAGKMEHRQSGHVEFDWSQWRMHPMWKTCLQDGIWCNSSFISKSPKHTQHLFVKLSTLASLYRSTKQIQ